MAGRIAVGILLTSCLLLPSSASKGDEDPWAERDPLEQRILDLERARAAYEEAAGEIERLKQRVEELERAKASQESDTRKQEQLEERVEELEVSKVAHEDATRSIIRQTFTEWGSNINQYVTFGGTLETLAGWAEDFDRQSERVLRLDTVELDFEIQVTDWIQGSLIVEYNDGGDTLFPTTDEDEATVDRINIDTAFVTIGDTQRFWPFAKVGRVIVPFGISTGDPVADVLTIEDPLTVEVFETREDAIWLGVEFPTPPTTPTTAAARPPRVKPLVVTPFVSRLSRRLGYKPFPTPPPQEALVTPTPELPPFRAGIYLYDGDTFERASDEDWNPGDHIGATVGYRTRENCSYFFCPWSLDVALAFNNSVFDSNFLEFEYRSFLQQIGFVPGMAASLQSTFGPVSLVAEWNGAIEDAKFRDDLGRRISIAPGAWQISLGYQFDWNPWVENIGAQGTYVTVGYSQSRDLEGVIRLIGGEQTRVGFAPKRRVLVGVGEWLTENVRLAVEYSHVVDYSKRKGGTGRSADGVLTMFTFEW